MKRLACLIGLAMAFGSGSLAAAAEAPGHLSTFLSAGEWRRLGPEPQASYLLGVLDALAVVADGAEKWARAMPERPPSFMDKQAAAVTRCTAGMTAGQVHSAVREYVEAHPAEAQAAVVTHVIGTFTARCGR